MFLQHAHAAGPWTTKLFVLIILILLFSATPRARAARPHADKALCKTIQHAVREGRTLEQIMADFQVDAQQVMTCTQGKGKRRKQKATKSKRAGSPAARQPPAIARISATQPVQR